MVARVFAEMLPSTPIAVAVRSNSPTSVLALKTIRSNSRLAQALPSGELQQRLDSPEELEFGPRAEYRAKELVELPEPLGFAVELSLYSPNQSIQQTPNGAADR